MDTAQTTIIKNYIHNKKINIIKIIKNIKIIYKIKIIHICMNIIVYII